MAAAERSQTEIARALGVSRNLVRYLEKRALRRLRGELRLKPVVIGTKSKGRPRYLKRQINSCGACGQLGHSRRTCKPGRA